MKAYPGGPMRHRPDFSVPGFDTLTARLRNEGHEVFNPGALTAQLRKMGLAPDDGEDHAARRTAMAMAVSPSQFMILFDGRAVIAQ